MEIWTTLRTACTAEMARARSGMALLPDPGVPGLLLRCATLLCLAAGLVWVLGGHRAGFAALNGLAPLLSPGIWSALTNLGDTAVALALFLVLARGNWHLARIVLIAAVIGLLWTHGVKHAAAVPRPAAVLASEAFHGIGALAVSGSFPSGHSQTAMTLASVACLTLRRRAWQGAALALGLAVCASRVIVGMHWPVDVLAGGAGGILSVLAAHLIVDRLGPPRAGPVILLLGLCLTAAVMVCAGHPTGYPAAQPWFRLLGLACLGGFLWGLLRTRA